MCLSQSDQTVWFNQPGSSLYKTENAVAAKAKTTLHNYIVIGDFPFEFVALHRFVGLLHGEGDLGGPGEREMRRHVVIRGVHVVQLGTQLPARRSRRYHRVQSPSYPTQQSLRLLQHFAGQTSLGRRSHRQGQGIDHHAPTFTSYKFCDPFRCQYGARRGLQRTHR